MGGYGHRYSCFRTLHDDSYSLHVAEVMTRLRKSCSYTWLTIILAGDIGPSLSETIIFEAQELI